MKLLWLVLLSVVASVSFGQGTPVPVRSSSMEMEHGLVNIKVDHMDVRTVVEDLMTLSGRRWSPLPRNVVGTVMVQFTRVPVETALLHVLRMVDAKYEVVDGVFVFTRNPPLEADQPATYSFRDNRFTHFDVSDGDVRLVLRQIMAATGNRYTIDSDLVGKVSLSLKDADVYRVLSSVLAQVGGLYETEGGAYRFTRTRRIRVGGGPEDVRLLVNGQPAVAAPPKPFKDDQKLLLDLKFEDADIREVLRSIFKKTNRSYAIDPDVVGPVTLTIKNVDWTVALDHALRQVDAHAVVEGGVIRVKRIPISPLPVSRVEVENLDGLVKVTAVDADVQDVIRSILAKRKVGLTIDPDVKGRITINLEAPLDVALRRVAQLADSVVVYQTPHYHVKRRG
jgi:type II secretory pathway component GspD/PulD (secretin)